MGQGEEGKERDRTHGNPQCLHRQQTTDGLKSVVSTSTRAQGSGRMFYKLANRHELVLTHTGIGEI